MEKSDLIEYNLAILCRLFVQRNRLVLAHLQCIMTRFTSNANVLVSLVNRKNND